MCRKPKQTRCLLQTNYAFKSSRARIFGYNLAEGGDSGGGDNRERRTGGRRDRGSRGGQRRGMRGSGGMEGRGQQQQHHNNNVDLSYGMTKESDYLEAMGHGHSGEPLDAPAADGGANNAMLSLDEVREINSNSMRWFSFVWTSCSD